ncbi:MAG: prephenate dehydratase [Candidatus Margulisiibacteriota bacterium]
MLKIGYLGPAGTFTEKAMQVYTRTLSVPFETQAGESFFELFEGLKNNTLTHAVIAIENSIEGAVAPNLDMLVQNETLKICADLKLPISQALITAEPLALDRITDIYSHPQGFAQCQTFLLSQLPKVRVHPLASTAEGVAHLKPGSTHAVIGAAILAELYHLHCHTPNIQDSKTNTTRFVVIAHDFPPPSGQDKTSIVFSTLKDKPGGLYEVLGAFAKRTINLTRIESRPTKQGLGDYVFFIDLEGHAADANVAEALDELQHKTSFYRLLGSYPTLPLPKEPS